MRIYLLVPTFLFVCISAQAQVNTNMNKEQHQVNVAKEIINSFEKNEFAKIPDYFDANMQKKLSPQNLKKFWGGLKQQVGNFKQLLDSSTKTTQKGQMLIQTLEFEKATLDFQLTFNPNNQVTAMTLTKSN